MIFPSWVKLELVRESPTRLLVIPHFRYWHPYLWPCYLRALWTHILG